MNEYNILQSGMGKNKPTKKPIMKDEAVAPAAAAPEAAQAAPEMQQAPVDQPVGLPVTNEQNASNPYRSYGNIKKRKSNVENVVGAANTFVRNAVHGTTLNLFKSPNQQDEAFPTAAALGQISPWFIPGSSTAKIAGKFLGKAVKWGAGLIGGPKAAKAVGQAGQVLGNNKVVKRAGQLAGKSLNKIKKYAGTTQILKAGTKAGEVIGKQVLKKTGSKTLSSVAKGATIGAGVYGGSSATQNVGHLARREKGFKRAALDTAGDAAFGGVFSGGGSAIAAGLKSIGSLATKGLKSFSKYRHDKNIEKTIGQPNFNPVEIERSFKKLKGPINQWSKSMSKKQFNDLKKSIPDSAKSSTLKGATNVSELFNQSHGNQKQHIFFNFVRQTLRKGGIKEADFVKMSDRDIGREFKKRMNIFNQRSKHNLNIIDKNYQPVASSTSAVTEKAYNKDFKDSGVPYMQPKKHTQLTPDTVSTTAFKKLSKNDRIGVAKVYQKNMKDNKGDFTKSFSDAYNKVMTKDKTFKVRKENYDKDTFLLNAKNINKVHNKHKIPKSVTMVNPKAEKDFNNVKKSVLTNFMKIQKKNITLTDANVVKIKSWLTTTEKQYKKPEFSDIQKNLRSFFNEVRGLVYKKIDTSGKVKGYQSAAKRFNTHKEILSVLDKSKHQQDLPSFPVRSGVSAAIGAKAGTASYGITEALNKSRVGFIDKAKKAKEAEGLYDNLLKSGMKKGSYVKDQPLYNTANLAGNLGKRSIKFNKKLVPTVSGLITSDTDKPKNKKAIQQQEQQQTHTEARKSQYVKMQMKRYRAKKAAAKKAKEAAAKAAKLKGIK